MRFSSRVVSAWALSLPVACTGAGGVGSASLATEPAPAHAVAAPTSPTLRVLSATAPRCLEHTGSGKAVMSADGCQVAFSSRSPSLVGPAGGKLAELLLYSCDRAELQVISRVEPAEPLEHDVLSPAISPNGRFVAFSTIGHFRGPDAKAAGLVLLDRQTGSRHEAALHSGVRAELLGVADDGRAVVFVTSAAVVPDDSNGGRDVYAYLPAERKLELWSRAPDGRAPTGVVEASYGGGNGRMVFVTSPHPQQARVHQQLLDRSAQGTVTELPAESSHCTSGPHRRSPSTQHVAVSANGRFLVQLAGPFGAPKETLVLLSESPAPDVMLEVFSPGESVLHLMVSDSGRFVGAVLQPDRDDPFGDPLDGLPPVHSIVFDRQDKRLLQIAPPADGTVHDGDVKLSALSDQSLLLVSTSSKLFVQSEWAKRPQSDIPDVFLLSNFGAPGSIERVPPPSEPQSPCPER